MDQHEGGGTVEKHNNAPRDGMGTPDPFLRKCGTKPGLEAPLVGGANLDSRVTRRAGKFRSGPQKATALPLRGTGGAAEASKQTFDLVSRGTVGLGKPPLIE